MVKPFRSEALRQPQSGITKPISFAWGLRRGSDSVGLYVGTGKVVLHSSRVPGCAPS